MAGRTQIWNRPKPVYTCPFCGADSTVLLSLASREDPKTKHYAVLCRECRARGPVKDSPAEAHEVWRERAAAK